MKKLLLIVCSLGMAYAGTAQMTGNLDIRADHKAKAPVYVDQNRDKADVEEWYNYTDELFNLSVGTNYFSILFPDTAVKMEYSNGYFPVNFHSMGQVFDPKDPLFFTHTTSIDSNDAYKIDSIAIPYRYFRHQTGAADTLVIHVFKHLDLLNASLVSNSRRFKTAEYDYTKFRGFNYSQEITEILDENDSTSSAKYLEYAINVSVMPGEVLGVTWTYIPGNPYSEGDTIFSTSHNVGNKINRFDQFYNSDDQQTYNDGYFNQGMVIPADVRYNTGTSWDGIYVSGIAYNNYINVNSYFKVVAEFVGVEEKEMYGFTVSQNSPNPFSNTSIINYELTEAANVVVEIFDITGKSVMVINEGRKNSGAYQVAIDGSSLNEGVYYYNFRTEAGQVTKKMMIQK